MKLCFLLLLPLIVTMSDGSSLTTYHYNNSECNIEPYKIVSKEIRKCPLKNLTLCHKNKNESEFSVCLNINKIYYKKHKTGAVIILTILSMLICFIVYKMCCESECDMFCLRLKRNVNGIFYTEEITYDQL